MKSTTGTGTVTDWLTLLHALARQVAGPRHDLADDLADPPPG